MADPVHPIDADADADDELATFREQWRQEVETRKRQHQEAAAQVKKPQQAATSSVRNVNVEQSDEQLPRERLRPRGILDAERTEEQKITSGILQDEVELARAIGSIQLGGGETHVSGKPTIHEHRSVKAHGKPSSAPAGGKPLSPKPRHAQPATFAKSTHTKDHTPTLYTTRKAVEAYSQAVDLESSGQLNEALHLYRKAYKLDDRVDKAYNSAVVKAEEKDRAEVVEKEVVDPTLRVVATPPPMEPYVFKTHTQLEGDYHSPVPTVRPASASASTAAATITKSADTQHAEWSDPLTRIINTFSEAETLYTLDFMPEEEKWPCLFGRLPDEVVENIVFFLDVQSLERFAASCKKARLVTRVAPVWRYVLRSPSPCLFGSGTYSVCLRVDQIPL
ncbi:hypothetical protein QFC22_004797 [Naganishia vaughanmartiniae]|uniref:Uncharacterized protein n=1 Tax=Naganishia vaughanmartiniae TaxID=1424756 RepID=A0ACC2WYY5_9TREE|nr:hypothetical protein QFC22_004797 [Naganishia vaughanmartiniae]